MVIPEDTGNQDKDSYPPDRPDQSASDSAWCWPSFDDEKSEESVAASRAMTFGSDQWDVEVVPGKAPDGDDRMSQAIEILLNASVHPRQ